MQTCARRLRVLQTQLKCSSRRGKGNAPPSESVCVSRFHNNDRAGPDRSNRICRGGMQAIDSCRPIRGKRGAAGVGGAPAAATQLGYRIESARVHLLKMCVTWNGIGRERASGTPPCKLSPARARFTFIERARNLLEGPRRSRGSLVAYIFFWIREKPRPA
eukprot:365083-Chlamydomonas_euryale.AAC.23